MKISEISIQTVKDYCGISDDDSDELVKNVLIPVAKAYISGYTGLPAEDLDRYDDFAYAMLILVNDMYTSREYTINLSRKVNPAVKTLLGLHSVNCL